MLRKTFGRREPSPLTTQPGARATTTGDRAHVLPDGLWATPLGEQMRKVGFCPNHPANAALTPEGMRALEDAATVRMNALVVKVNAHIPHVSVIPWAILPWSVWRNENAVFLMSGDFFPSSPWNNLLLAADDYSSTFLGLPRHPRTVPPGLDERISHLVDELRGDFQQQMNRFGEAIARGDLTAVNGFEQAKKERFQKLFALARHVAQLTFGEEVCTRHDELFGIGLSQVIG
jgi:hypothetical protein